MWTVTHSEAFCKLKEEIRSPQILALYDTAEPTKVSADASAYMLGAVLLQLQKGLWQPVAFASLRQKPAMPKSSRKHWH